jgi:hypothetical protein
MTGVLLRRVQAARPGAQGDDNYDVIDADGLVVGRIFKSTTSPFVGTPWIWTLTYGDHKDRTPTHGYTATREAAMAAFAKRLAAGMRPSVQ